MTKQPKVLKTVTKIGRLTLPAFGNAVVVDFDSLPEE